MGSRIAWALGLLLFAAFACPALGAEKLLMRSERERPSWVSRPPPAQAGLIYFTGRHNDATSIEAGTAAAFRDAAKQIAGYIGTRVTSKLIVRTTHSESKIVDEIRAAARGDLSGAKVEDVYWEQAQVGSWARKRRFYRVWALVGYPESGIARERRRLRNLGASYDAEFDRLCSGLAGWLRANARRGRVRVGGFKESLSENRYAFSRIVERNLSDCLARSKVRVTQGANQTLLVTGAYHRVTGEVAVSARVLRMEDGENLFAENIAIPEDAIVPEWLTVKEEREESFFKGLEQWEAARHKAVGALSVDSRPRGASVLVDGGSWKATAPADLYDIPVGVHSVVFSLDDYELHSETVRISPGEKVVLSPTLKFKMGTMKVISKPSGAQVFLDGALIGETTLRRKVKIGTHMLRLKKEGYKDEPVGLRIDHRETTYKNVTLTEADGSLVVVSDPPKAKVFVNHSARPIGKTPLNRDPFFSGEYQITVTKEGYGRWSGTVRVRPYEPTTVTVTLTEVESGQVVIKATPANATLEIDDQVHPEFYAVGIYDLPAGKHKIALKRIGYKPWKKKIRVKPGGVYNLKPQLRRETYTASGSPIKSDSLASKIEKGVVRGVKFIVLAPIVVVLMIMSLGGS